MVLERRDGGNAADYLFLHFMGSIAELDLLLPPPSSAAILAAHSELWLYRDALSYFPR
jgi:hypothetical protein